MNNENKKEVLKLQIILEMIKLIKLKDKILNNAPRAKIKQPKAYKFFLEIKSFNFPKRVKKVDNIKI